ncbi:unnamed protein product [Merluccius merluccius]
MRRLRCLGEEAAVESQGKTLHRHVSVVMRKWSTNLINNHATCTLSRALIGGREMKRRARRKEAVPPERGDELLSSANTLLSRFEAPSDGLCGGGGVAAVVRLGAARVGPHITAGHRRMCRPSSQMAQTPALA